MRTTPAPASVESIPTTAVSTSTETIPTTAVTTSAKTMLPSGLPSADPLQTTAVPTSDETIPTIGVHTSAKPTPTTTGPRTQQIFKYKLFLIFLLICDLMQLEHLKAAFFHY